MKALFAATVLSVFTLATNAQVIYNSSGRPRSENRDRDQKREPYFKKGEGLSASRIMWGGGLQLGLGGGVFAGGLSPIIGYNITDNFSAGVGLGYLHYREEGRFPINNQITGQTTVYPLIANFYTPRLWTRYLVWRNLFIHAEGEYNFSRYKVWDIERSPTSPNYLYPVSEKITVTAPALLIGPGIRQPLSEKVSFVTMLLLETLRDPQSPYAGSTGPGGFPLDLRFGINVNFGAPAW